VEFSYTIAPRHHHRLCRHRTLRSPGVEYFDGVISGSRPIRTTLISLTATNAAGTSLPQNLSITINPAATFP